MLWLPLGRLDGDAHEKVGPVYAGARVPTLPILISCFECYSPDDVELPECGACCAIGSHFHSKRVSIGAKHDPTRIGQMLPRKNGKLGVL